MKAVKEESSKFKVYLTEIETNVITRGPIIVSEETHPELKGMSEKEVIDYVQKNAWDMKTDSEYYESLGEELGDSDVVKDKIIPESSEIIVEKYDDNDEDDDSYDDED